MIYANTFVSVLALVVAASVALVWTISSRRTRALESQLSTTQSNLKALVAKLVDAQRSISDLKSTAPTALAAEVVALREAVSKLADTQRRFQGRFDARMGGARAPVVIDGELGEVDEELSAMLALQKAAPPAP